MLFSKGQHPYDVVVMASSLGGISALKRITADLPGSFPIPIVVAQHARRCPEDVLPAILARGCRLRVIAVRHGQPLEPGTIFIAPPDHNTLVMEGGWLALSRRENLGYPRPSADLLFTSAALVFKERAIGVVLTGLGSDGALGSHTLRRQGGFLIAQNERTAAAFGMPGAARDVARADLVLPLNQIAYALESLVMPRAESA